MTEKNKSIDVNNSDSAFVAGVLYGLMHAIDILILDKIDDCGDNLLAKVVNTTLEFPGKKLLDAIALINTHKRVPDLRTIVKELRDHPKRKEVMENRKKILNDLWEKLNENQRVRG